jgi:hypothetical protein
MSGPNAVERISAHAGLCAILASLAMLCVGIAASGQDIWREFRMPEADFVVTMPGAPHAVSRNTDPSGTTFRQYVLERTPVTFSVSYLVFPSGTVQRAGAEKVIDVARNTLVKEYGAKVREEQALAFGGGTARDVTLELPESAGQAGGIAKLRVYVLGDRQYTLMVLTSPGFEQGPGIMRFLDSFRIVEQ